MNLFDKQEDKFLKKIDTAFSMCFENQMSNAFFADRIDKIVMTSAIQGNQEYEKYVAQAKKDYKAIAQERRFERTNANRDENSMGSEDNTRSNPNSPQNNQSGSFLEKLKVLNNRVQTFQETFQGR